jgi:hypothetical protein
MIRTAMEPKPTLEPQVEPAFESICDRCEEVETEGNPVNGQWADSRSAYGDPEPPELTWLCKRCVESEEVLY